MTLKELIKEGIIKDEDRIVVKKAVAGNLERIASGNWYQDRVLEYMEAEIYSLSYVKGRGWTVNLDRIEV